MQQTTTQSVATSQFLEDVLQGLLAKQKYLQSKYFYDAAGDKLFQQIMHCEDYYPTRCELDIFKNQSIALANFFKEKLGAFDVIELGAGDALKSSYLLRELLDNQSEFTYMPIDISKNVIDLLESTLPKKLAGLRMKGLNGQYFEMLEEAYRRSSKPKVVLFLGSNLGNMLPEDARNFCTRLYAQLQPGDLLFIGLDLKKNPSTILKAYNDKDGYTRQFNLNLLKRMNRELEANFDLDQFEHYPSYDPISGACKSYLVSLADQEVRFGSADTTITFKANEVIFMEISQKYTVDEVRAFASGCGFKTLQEFFDRKGWFMDTVWQR